MNYQRFLASPPGGTGTAVDKVNWLDLVTMVSRVCVESPINYSEFLTSQVMTAAVALFQDGNALPSERRLIWEQLSALTFEMVEEAHARGLLNPPPSSKGSA